MNYTKPVIASCSEAINAIQSPHSKLNAQIADNPVDLPERSIAAYEADE
jgi:hypothetical protein